jgi:hypothetical protein
MNVAVPQSASGVEDVLGVVIDQAVFLRLVDEPGKAGLASSLKANTTYLGAWLLR